ncbi:HSPB1-associated protein 1 homolog isoform X1 [Neodiprion lecontei]|uniref:HSPB1-associated protein 1 homolog isoform X1 n=2 Tax=Neodiprion lecontei TaxID=441921 RepID=A0ABM3FHH6_NEOLC|nr:HSPB1-associated protein 1 homolog isoform X1 [Neodiprion lecontei]
MQSTSSLQEPSETTLRHAILQLIEPVVFNNLLRDSNGKYLWKFLDWNPNDLAEKLGDLKLPFRIGFNARTTEPQWDFKCDVKSMTMRNFLQNVGTLVESNEWQYFDYKYMHEWFSHHPEILSSFDWKRFGFDQRGEDSTLWIGSQGAHTNCHQDTYGCNLVAQVHGRKRWLLFSPDSHNKLQPTRVPYEESTVYSSFNFFCPSKDDEEALLRTDPKARMVILEPGQVLLVPNGWWHYVESIDLSISVNIWIPLAADCHSRVGEALVNLIVKEIGKGFIPTSDKTLDAPSEAVRLIQTCIEKCNVEKDDSPSVKKFKETRWSAKELVEQYSNYVTLIPVLKNEELQELLSKNRDRFPDIKHKYLEMNSSNQSSVHQQIRNDVVNALCHPDVIEKVTHLILRSSHLRFGDERVLLRKHYTIPVGFLVRIVTILKIARIISSMHYSDVIWRDESITHSPNTLQAVNQELQSKK